MAERQTRGIIIEGLRKRYGAGETAVEYIGAHVCSSKTVVHKVFHNHQYPSHLLLPAIPITC